MHVVVYPKLSSFCEPWKLFILLLFPTFIAVHRPSGKVGETQNSLKVRAAYNRWKVHKKLEKFFMISKKKSSVSKSNNATERAHVRSVDFEWNAACGALNHCRRAAMSWERGEQNATSCEHWMPKWRKTEAEIKLFYDKRKAACCRLTFHHSAAHS